MFSLSKSSDRPVYFFLIKCARSKTVELIKSTGSVQRPRVTAAEWVSFLDYEQFHDGKLALTFQCFELNQLDYF